MPRCGTLNDENGPDLSHDCSTIGLPAPGELSRFRVASSLRRWRQPARARTLPFVFPAWGPGVFIGSDCSTTERFSEQQRVQVLAAGDDLLRHPRAQMTCSRGNAFRMSCSSFMAAAVPAF